MTINPKVAKIHPDLFEARILFNQRIIEKLGVDDFPKIKSDMILAKAIQEDLINFDLTPKIKGKRLESFDIKWR